MTGNWKFGLVASVAAAVCVGSFLAGGASGEEKKVANERVYELRTYTTLPGRLEALHKRFRDHTMKLFEKHGIKNEAYWVPTDENLRENTLIYIVSHESEEAAEKSWTAFRADPEWNAAKEASEADGKIVAKVEKVFMKRTPYSPGK